MPATRKSTKPTPKAASRPAAAAPPRPTLRNIAARDVAFGFAAMHWVFVGFVVLLLEIVGTRQILLTFGAQAVIAALVWNVGVIIALLLLVWLIKGYAEARWYSIAVGFPLQLCLAVYMYPMSRWFSALTCVSLAATAIGVLKLIAARSRKTVRAA
jgi:hypothetical protein